MTQKPRSIASFRSSDARALAALSILTTLVAWNRFRYDSWLARFDILTFYLPWYAYLGQRLRAFDVPGWNPHLFSGTPFAADPQSGWMYLPAMLTFPFLGALTAYKAMVALQLVVAGVSTYAFARVLGLGATAALVSAVVFLFGPFLQWNTDCCAVMGQFAAWVPLTLLGIELALRAERWQDRLMPWCLAGIGFSQVLGGWVGEGWLDGLLLVAGYVGYRTLLSPPREIRGIRARLVQCATTGAAVLALAFALGAAGVLPRLAVNAETNLAGADYERLSVPSIDNLPWTFAHLLTQIFGSGYDRRATTYGGAAIVLALLALPLARRRFAVPYFAALTVACLTLTLDTTPLHDLFYLIPRFRVIHEHDPWRIVGAAAIGPAMLAGATVESLASWRGRRRLLPVVVVPMLLIAFAASTVPDSERFVGWAPLIAAGVTTLVVALAVMVKSDRAVWPAVALLLAVAVAQPLGTELTGSWFGWPRDPRWESRWHPDPIVGQALRTEVAETDPDGAGAYLKRELVASGPFRYAGYAGVGYPVEKPRLVSYMSARLQPNIQAILANGRPMVLGLYDVQGYNPVQLDRYVDFINAVNAGTTQDYHTAYVLAGGARSPLLDLLDLRYLLVDASLPPDRSDIAALTAGRREVFRTDRVVVYATDLALPHAWIVHDVRRVGRGEALPMLAGGALNPGVTALIEGTVPAVAAPTDPKLESARITRYEPDALSVAVNATAPGLLVVSEIYASGWKAYVDGRPTPILPTDHVLRGVPIPANARSVELRYEPRSLQVGMVISGIAALVVMGIFAFGAWSMVRRRSTVGHGYVTERSRPSPDNLRPTTDAGASRVRHPEHQAGPPRST